MASRIDAVATRSGGLLVGRSGRRLANAAARACLSQAGLDADDIDLLINVGLFHDRLLGEPAFAALIQEDIAANVKPHPGREGTFSFDIANGACGMLTGLQVADGFLRAGTIRRALVVASDADPGRGLAEDFPYEPMGAAMLCSWTDDGGVSGFRFANRPGWDASRAVVGGVASTQLRIVEDPEFSGYAAEVAAMVANDSLRDQNLSVADVDVVIANPQRPEFLAKLTAALGIAGDRVVQAPQAESVHTAGFGMAFEAALDAGAAEPGATCLLVSAAAGVTAGAAVMRASELAPLA